LQGSIERVRTVINGQIPDRPPLYELLRNDAVISYFAGETMTLENAPQTVYRAYEPAVDATRPSVRLPSEEKTLTLDDGRMQRHFRWTTWTGPRVYGDSEAYAAAKKAYIDNFDSSWTAKRQAQMEQTLSRIDQERRRLGEVFFFPGGLGGLGLAGIYGEVGLEHFSYYLADCPGIIDDLFECNTISAVTRIEHLPGDHGIEAVFCADDIAFKSGPLLAPSWFEKHYFPRFSRIIDAYHRKGIKVLFHSDGNLNPILSGLVEAGIDGLNPIEVCAGMDVGDIHRRYPHLFMAGGIDVSQLLPFGKPAEIKDVVRQTIEAAEGRIMIGSSTELHNDVPLGNYLALREAVLEYSY